MRPAARTTHTATPEAAYAWAHAAAKAATALPVDGAEAVAWMVRGWAEVALGCVVIDSPAAFAGLDDVVADVVRENAGRLRCAGPFALRLRTLRC